jgi:hypothetical protein
MSVVDLGQIGRAQIENAPPSTRHGYLQYLLSYFDLGGFRVQSGT